MEIRNTPVAPRTDLPTGAYLSARAEAVPESPPGEPRERFTSAAPTGSAAAPMLETTSTPPAPTPADGLADSLKRLEQAGYRNPDEQRTRLESAFENAHECLARFEHPHTTVASFTSEQEVQLYSRLAGVCGGDTLNGLSEYLKVSEPERHAHHQLNELEEAGGLLYFSRRKARLADFLPLPAAETWLRTDSAGATVLLARGESVRAFRPDGSEVRIHSLKQAATLQTGPAQERRREAVELLDELAGLNPQVQTRPNLEQPRDMLLTDFDVASRRELTTTLASPFREQLALSAPLQYQKMIDDLVEGREVVIQPEGSYPFYPTLVNLEGLKTVSQFLSRGTPEMICFHRGVGRLEQTGGMLFARQAAGEGQGALVKADALSGYLALQAGSELVVLDNKGNLQPCRTVDQFLDSVYLSDAPEDAKAFYKDLRVLERRGFSLLTPRPEDPSRYQRADAVDGYVALKNQQLVRLEGPEGRSRPVGWSQVRNLANEYIGPPAPSFPAQDRPRVDPTTPKPNLFMVYYNALHDPTSKFGYYDDFPIKLQEVGSSEHMDLVMCRSDLPSKNNLRTDYVQPGHLEQVSAGDARDGMNDPRVFENFVHDTIRNYPDRDHVRLMVVGHGGGEHGVVDDVSNGRIMNMSVDDFAEAISRALDRVQRETGKRPVIDNLIMGSCLMGNTSLVDALARRKDVKTLCASPEVLLDGFPKSLAEALNDPARAGSNAQDFARQVVDLSMQATGLEGGRENRRHALIYGAYDLDADKADSFRGALKEFFGACLSASRFAAYYRQDIQKCPGYNIHPSGGPGIGSDERDLIQVAERILGDARIESPRVKAAAQKLIEAAQDQVIHQVATERYQGRKGPSLLLPLRPEDYRFPDEAPTDLLRETDYQNFLKMLFAAPDRRSAHEMAAEAAYQAKGDSTAQLVADMEPLSRGQVAREENELLDDLQLAIPTGSAIGRGLARAGTAVAASLAAVAGGALGAVIGAVAGTALGARAGWSGDSIRQNYRPHTEVAPVPGPPAEAQGGPAPPRPEPKTVLQAIDRNPQIGEPAILAPAEFIGSELHQHLSYRFGNALATLVAAPLGAISGLLGGALTGMVLGGVSAGQAVKARSR